MNEIEEGNWGKYGKETNKMFQEIELEQDIY